MRQMPDGFLHLAHLLASPTQIRDQPHGPLALDRPRRTTQEGPIELIDLRPRQGSGFHR